MALKISDRVKETTVTTGTGTITLGGAVTGFRTFASVLSNADTTYYAIVGSSEFEVGLGTFSGSTLTRDTVLSSSNSGNKVDFAAGTKNVFITQPADKAVYKDENDTIDINTDNVTEGSTNLYFTNERVDDRVGSLLVAGDNVTLSYDDAAGTLTISATEDNLSNNDTDDLAEGSTNLYYTDTRFDTRLATKDTDNISEGATNLYHTTERVQDVVGGQFITNGTHTGISFSYDDFTDGAIDATVSLSSFSTSDLSEGTNLYYTTARFDSAFSGKSTSDLSEGTNLYYTTARFDTAFSGKDTDDLSEGLSNLYYTNERVDDRVANLIQNGTGISFAYNDTLGTLTPTVSLSAFNTDNLSEGSTNLYYTNTRANAAIDARVTQSYVNALNVEAASVQANSVALGTDTTGNYVATISGTANKVSVTGSGSESAAVTLSLPDDVQIANDLTVAGDLTVNGATTTLGTTNLEVSDNLFELNSGLTTAPVNDSGMLIQRGTSDNAVFMWDESVDKFTLGTTTATAASTGNIIITTGSLVANLEGNVTGNVTGTVSSLSNHDTGDLAEGSNLYHTTERVQDIVGGQLVTNGTHTGVSFAYDDAGDGAIDATVSLSSFSTSDLSEGTNLYYTDARFDTRLAAKSTSDLSEGTNLYYTTARFDSAFAGKSTSDLSEGTNLYYTDARVESYLDGGTSTPSFATISSGAITTTTNASGYALIIEENSGGEQYQIGTDSFGGLAFFNSGTKVADFTDSSEFQLYSSGAVKAKISPLNHSYINSGFKFGIGLTSPSSTLHVVSTGTTTGGAYVYSNAIHTGSDIHSLLSVRSDNASATGTVVDIRGDGTGDILHVKDGTSTAFVVKDGGNVGIGTSSPDTLLHLSATDGSAIVRLERNDTTIASTDVYGEIQFEGQDASAGSAAGVRGKILGVAEGPTGEMALAFQTAASYSASTERMRIDSSGNVGIGRTSISQPSSGATTLAIQGTSTTKGGAIQLYSSDDSVAAYIYPDSTNGLSINTSTSHPMVFRTAATERMRIDASGNVGIGLTPASTNKLEVFGNIKVNAGNDNGFLLGGNCAILRQDSTQMGFETNGSEAMRIDSSGNLLVGTTTFSSPTDGFTVSASNETKIQIAHINGTGSGVAFASFLYNGSTIGSITQFGTTATNYNTSSDYRLKENVVDMEGALDRVAQLQPKRFNFIADADKTVDGFLAHEVASVVPEAISGEKDAVDDEDNPIYQGIDQSKLVPLLVKAVQELTDKVEALEAQLQGN